MVRSRSTPGMRAAAAHTLPPDLYDYADPPQRPDGQPSIDAFADWCVIDDWPARVPVTFEEADMFEAWFGDIIGELFGPHP